MIGQTATARDIQKVADLSNLSLQCSSLRDAWRALGCLSMSAYFQSQAAAYLNAADRIASQKGMKPQ